MTTNRPLLYVLLIAAFTVLIVAVTLVGYNLLSLAFGQPPTPTPTAVASVPAPVPSDTPVGGAPDATAAPLTPTATTTTVPPTPEAPVVTVVAELLNVRSGPEPVLCRS